jgi:hypothetical protein
MMKAFNVANVLVKKASALSRRPHELRRGSTARVRTSAQQRTSADLGGAPRVSVKKVKQEKE